MSSERKAHFLCAEFIRFQNEGRAKMSSSILSLRSLRKLFCFKVLKEKKSGFAKKSNGVPQRQGRSRDLPA